MTRANKKRAKTNEDKLMELYDKLASQWAQKVEAANKSKT